MYLSAVADQPDEGPSRLSMQFHAGRRSFSFEHRVSSGAVSETGDAALAAALLQAMRWGGTLEMDAPVSPRLLANLDAIQEAFLGHSRRFHRVQVIAPSAPARDASGRRGVACFFSGGVDSFYSALCHRDEITHLIFVHGFDFGLEQRDLRRRVSSSVARAAAALGMELIEVESDVRRFADRFLDWPYEYLGASLASVAHMLAPRFRKVYVASGYAPGLIMFSGSSPELDPLWSTDSVEIVHDGQVARLEKIAAIAESPVALASLRVCWENRGGAYNCGRCPKCLLTMAALRMIGALERCETFPLPLDLEALSRMPVTSAYSRILVESYLDAAGGAGDADVVEAMRSALRRATPLRRAYERLKERAGLGFRHRWESLRRSAATRGEGGIPPS
jgi:hypothetical protein